MDDDRDATNAEALLRGMPFPPHPLGDACVADWYCAAHRAEDDA
jgi:hypothetical protein